MNTTQSQSPSPSVKVFSRDDVRVAKRHTAKLLGRAAANQKAGNRKSVRHMAVEYLQSPHARLLAAQQAYYALGRDDRPTLEQVAWIIKSLDAWQKSNEEVVVTAKWKDNGEYRAISNFGFEHRTRQYLVADFLSSIAVLHPDQYGTRGGVPAAIDRVSELLRAGYVWTIELDIANCFPSFEGKNLHNFLPLPEKVIAHTIRGDTLIVVPGDNLLKVFGPAEDDPGNLVGMGEILAAARRGFPQGSAAASIVAEMLIAVPLKTLPSAGRVPSYADNMLIMAKSEEDAVSMSNALLSAFKAHPVGHLTPTLKSQSCPGQWVQFLGHCLRVDGQVVQIVPSPKNEEKFAKRIKTGLKTVGNTHLSGYVRRARARRVRRDIKSWTSNFSRCDGMKERKKHWLGKIDVAIGAISK
jgi:hypothetical protein